MMRKTSNATAVVQARRPFSPGPSSAIRYDVLVYTEGGGVIRFNDVSSDLVMYGDEVAVMPAEIGTEHRASVVADRLTLWITPMLTTIDCEDIE